MRQWAAANGQAAGFAEGRGAEAFTVLETG
jgi:hypothetical protein